MKVMYTLRQMAGKRSSPNPATPQPAPSSITRFPFSFDGQNLPFLQFFSCITSNDKIQVCQLEIIKQNMHLLIDWNKPTREDSYSWSTGTKNQKNKPPAY